MLWGFSAIFAIIIRWGETCNSCRTKLTRLMMLQIMEECETNNTLCCFQQVVVVVVVVVIVKSVIFIKVQNNVIEI